MTLTNNYRTVDHPLTPASATNRNVRNSLANLIKGRVINDKTNTNKLNQKFRAEDLLYIITIKSTQPQQTKFISDI